jgi:hypothetical protein
VTGVKPCHVWVCRVGTSHALIGYVGHRRRTMFHLHVFVRTRVGWWNEIDFVIGQGILGA